MIVGLYGAIPFTTGSILTQTFDNLRQRWRANWKTHDIHLQKPLGEWTGPGLVEVEFTMNLSTRWGLNPHLLLLQLHRYQGPPPQPAFLFMGGRPVGGGLSLFAITDLDESHKYFSRMGMVIGAEVSVKMTEYISQAPLAQYGRSVF